MYVHLLVFNGARCPHLVQHATFISSLCPERRRWPIQRCLVDAAEASLSAGLRPPWLEDKLDGVDHAVVSLDVHRVGRSAAVVRLLANNRVVHESLASEALVGEGLAVERLHAAGNGSERDLALGDVVLHNLRSHVALDERVDWREDGVLAAAEVNARLVHLFLELAEVVVALDLVLADRRILEAAFRAPADVRALAGGQSLSEVGVQHGSAHRARSHRGEGGGASEESKSYDDFGEHD
mmetsp:Transcript_65215/g.122131  ORF Transcript_65215/g.122131 Transcript_65215/m.122131 type:complete len:239 (-) Transcript_65215:46-762(-)